MNIPVSEAKAKFSELIRRAEAGEEVILTRNGKPVAKLSEAAKPLSKGELRQQIMGKFRDEIWIEDDFDELGPEWDEYTR